MKKKRSFFLKTFTWGFLLFQSFTQSAVALELDWTGQFWSEFNFVGNYSMDESSQGSTLDNSRNSAGGYYIPGAGSRDAAFFTLFFRLRPRLIVNDNIYIKSEWWLGSPAYSFFGGAVPQTFDQRQFYSSQSRGASITAQRFWVELLSDIGTFQVGRVPLHWGLGIVWNSGDELWDRFMSTGDAIRWIAKFGSFSFIPSFIVRSAGNTFGGSCIVDPSTGACTPGNGSGMVSDYSIILKYENTDDEVESGINLIRRYGGAGQDPNSGYLTPSSVIPSYAGSMNFITYDLYAKKKWNRFTVGAELPIISGTLSGNSYHAQGFAGEVNWKATEISEFLLKGGYASGQSNQSGSTLGSFDAFFFNPNYHIGMILFNYQLYNFSQPQVQNNPNLTSNPQSLRSPFDNPIVNAIYGALSAKIKPSDKWTFKPAVLYAAAPQRARSGQYFYNYWTRSISPTPAITDQGTSLGFEIDLGISFEWDENFILSWDNGLFLPGSFYAFSNAPRENARSAVFATALRAGINF